MPRPYTEKASNMSVYTVHVPPTTGQSAPDPGRFVFVRDGFSFWAFLLGPVWMLWHGLWLVLVGYVVVVLLLQVGLHLIGASAAVKFVAGLLLALLIGFEAASLRRFKLARRRWKDAGIVVGDDTESAERRFFGVWMAEAPRPPAPPQTVTPLFGAAPGGPAAPPSEIIGLFPQPGGPR
jgi:hypothetical protein